MLQSTCSACSMRHVLQMLQPVCHCLCFVIYSACSGVCLSHNCRTNLCPFQVIGLQSRVAVQKPCVVVCIMCNTAPLGLLRVLLPLAVYHVQCNCYKHHTVDPSNWHHLLSVLPKSQRLAGLVFLQGAVCPAHCTVHASLHAKFGTHQHQLDTVTFITSAMLLWYKMRLVHGCCCAANVIQGCCSRCNENAHGHRQPISTAAAAVTHQIHDARTAQ
jgi:hypothetical protein